MFHGIQFPYFNSQQLNLDWIVDKIKGMLDFLPDDGTAGQILRRTADGAEWSDERQVSGGAVDSVNGKTGDVVLDAGDILMDDNSSVEDAVDDLKSAITYVTPEMYGAKGDGVTDDSAALLNALNSGECVVLSNVYNVGSVIRPSAEAICIIGNGGEVTGASLVFSNSDLLIHSVKFANSETNAINLTNCVARIIDCTFSDVGISISLTPASEGAAVYFSGGDVRVVNCKIEKTHGHASIFGTSADKYLISGNDISSPYYRGIEIYDSSSSSGIIANNFIEDTGKLLSGNSGVGCNGIYVNPAVAGLSIVGNIVKNCVENGIEAGAGKILNNVIDGTGADASKVTQSTEGIFINGDNCIVKGNTVRNTKTFGIRANRSGDISGLVIAENTIVGSGNNSAIDLNSYTSKIVKNTEISNNTGDGSISFAGANSPQTNLIKNNVQSATRQALNAIKNIKDFSIKADLTTFDDETIGGFTANNVAVTYTDGADGGKIANVAYNQYGRLSKTIKRLPNGLLYGITLTVQGDVTIYVYKGGSYYTNSRAFSSPSVFSDFSFVWETPEDIEIRIQGVTGETLLISSIREYVVDPNA